MIRIVEAKQEQEDSESSNEDGPAKSISQQEEQVHRTQEKFFESINAGFVFDALQNKLKDVLQDAESTEGKEIRIELQKKMSFQFQVRSTSKQRYKSQSKNW